MDQKQRTEGITANADGGFVFLDGPGVAETLEPDAAGKTSDQMKAASIDAQNQRERAADDQAPNLGHSRP